MWHELRLFLIALQRLTRLSAPAWVGGDERWLQASTRHFGGVGLLMGGLAAAVLWAAAHVWPALVSVLLCMAFTAWVTGARPEDGLARTCEALAGSADRAQVLALLQDTRLGTRGAVGLLLVLALKAAALHGLATRDLLATLAVLPLAYAWSCAGGVLLLRGLSVPPPDGLTLLVTLTWALLAAAGAALYLPASALLAAALAGVAVTLGMARGLHQRLGACTAETLGATQQLSELAVYLAVLGVLAAG